MTRGLVYTHILSFLPQLHYRQSTTKRILRNLANRTIKLNTFAPFDGFRYYTTQDGKHQPYNSISFFQQQRTAKNDNGRAPGAVASIIDQSTNHNDWYEYLFVFQNFQAFA